MPFCVGSPPTDGGANIEKLRKTRKPVLVTGATGYVAGHIIEQLLKSGEVVRGTVRDAKNTEKYQHLVDMENSGLLDIVQCDILDEKSVTAAVEGCEYVYHVASPFIMDTKNPQEDLVDPAVNGTLNVLRACVEHKVKKVVVTSSIAAAADSGSSKVINEECWNTQSSLKRMPYMFSKAQAEKAAWDFVKELPEDNKLNLVTVLPTLVIGPSHIASLNESHKAISEAANGKVPVLAKLGFNFIDVRDVAKAHILAMNSETAEGRYLCTNEHVMLKDMVDILRTEYPNCRWPMKVQVPNFVAKLGSYAGPKSQGQFIRSNAGKQMKIDNSKIVKDLKMEFIPVEQSLKETLADLIKRGHVVPKGNKKEDAPATEEAAAEEKEGEKEGEKKEEAKVEELVATVESIAEGASPSKAEKRKSTKAENRKSVKSEAAVEAKAEELVAAVEAIAEDASPSKSDKRKSTKAEKRKSTKGEAVEEKEEAKVEEAKAEEGSPSKAEKRKSTKAEKRKSTKADSPAPADA